MAKTPCQVTAEGAHVTPFQRVAPLACLSTISPVKPYLLAPSGHSPAIPCLGAHTPMLSCSARAPYTSPSTPFPFPALHPGPSPCTPRSNPPGPP